MTELSAQHPLLTCVAELGSTLDDAAQLQPTFLSADEKATAMRELAAVEARVVALRMRVMAVADDTAEKTAARDVAAWWSHETRSEPDAARADERLARSLDRDRPRVAEALAAGRCSVAQARVIVHALDELPDDVEPDIVERAEAALVDYAEQFRPSQLRRLGRRILHVVAPDIADEQEARKLADLERNAARRTHLSLRPMGDGTTRLSGLIPEAAGSRLRTYLEAFTSPRRAEADGPLAPDDRRPYGRRLGEAFCALLEHLDPAKLPHHGGDATTVIVTIPLDQLRSEIGTATVLDGEVAEGSSVDGSSAGAVANLSAAEARRLACTARILPAVLGGDSEILDLGRAERLFTPAQRRALRLRDKRCRAEGCTIPATWCEAHHLVPWLFGGLTDLDNGILLCSHHHHRAHDDRYRFIRLASGDLRFIRRT
ncbi:MAG TPA: DUF222 domain-containing protein [Marmoricola sp.]|nr:DUF222 domain-containing protein [Marmoricola sp.]